MKMNESSEHRSDIHLVDSVPTKQVLQHLVGVRLDGEQCEDLQEVFDLFTQ